MQAFDYLLSLYGISYFPFLYSLNSQVYPGDEVFFPRGVLSEKDCSFWYPQLLQICKEKKKEQTLGVSQVRWQLPRSWWYLLGTLRVGVRQLQLYQAGFVFTGYLETGPLETCGNHSSPLQQCIHEKGHSVCMNTFQSGTSAVTAWRICSSAQVGSRDISHHFAPHTTGLQLVVLLKAPRIILLHTIIILYQEMDTRPTSENCHILN